MCVCVRSLVCVVGIIYVHVDTVLGFFMGTFFCLVGCLSMIVWTSAVLGVSYACVLFVCCFFLYLHLFSACFTWKGALEIHT